MHPFLLAFQLLTIIPISHTFIATDKQVGYSCLFYPMIGLLIGGCLVALATLLASIPFQIQASLILILWVIISGGLHLDGLADCADAWVGGFANKQRSLTIMKDPRSGPIAIAVLVLLLLLKWTLISHLLEQQFLTPLILAPMLARLAILILMLSTNYIRSGGMAETLVKHLPKPASYCLSLIGLLVGAYYLGIIAIGFMLLILFIIRDQANRRLGGTTGDVYGAAVELVEAGVLLGAIV